MKVLTRVVTGQGQGRDGTVRVLRAADKFGLVDVLGSDGAVC